MSDRAETKEWCGVRGYGRRVLATALALALAACADPGPPRATLSVADLMAGDDTVGFARAYAPRAFDFPADHGPHPGYRHEWWYFTGNVATVEGRPFGFMLTFFRSALRPEPEGVESAWATDEAFMAHFAVTDIQGSGFRAFERFDRGALGLAYARGEPLEVGVGDWTAIAWPREGDPAKPFPAFRVRAAEGDVAIDLVLEARRPPVLQGDDGLSRKGPEPGNASYYYSMTRLAAGGTVTVAGERHAVRGLAWLDREWGTSALGPELAGWDWFSLQLDDGTDLMYYQLRRHDGSADPLSAGSILDGAGERTGIAAGDVVLQATGHWTSPRGVRYPVDWRLALPAQGLVLRIRPALRDQEMDLTFRYWEGAVIVDGTGPGGRPVRGRGYVELTGYADAAGAPSAVDARGSRASSPSTGRPRNRSAR